MPAIVSRRDAWRRRRWCFVNEDAFLLCARERERESGGDSLRQVAGPSMRHSNRAAFRGVVSSFPRSLAPRSVVTGGPHCLSFSLHIARELPFVLSIPSPAVHSFLLSLYRELLFCCCFFAFFFVHDDAQEPLGVSQICEDRSS